MAHNTGRHWNLTIESQHGVIAASILRSRSALTAGKSKGGHPNGSLCELCTAVFGFGVRRAKKVQHYYGKNATRFNRDNYILRAPFEYEISNSICTCRSSCIAATYSNPTIRPINGIILTNGPHEARRITMMRRMTNDENPIDPLESQE